MNFKVNLEDYGKNKWYSVVGVLMAFRCTHIERKKFNSKYSFLGSSTSSPKYLYIFFQYFLNRKYCLDALCNDIEHPL